MTKSALLFEMIDLLRRRPGISVDELSSTLGRTQRTVYRWLNELATDLQTPVYFNSGGYYLSSSEEDAIVDFSPEELLALRLSLKALPFAEGSPVERHALTAWDKIRNAASTSKLRRMAEQSGTHMISVTAPKHRVQPDLIEQLARALNSHYRLLAVYRSQKSNVVKQYILNPYAMAFRRHSWYVLAFSSEHGKVIQLKLARFIKVKVTEEKFEAPDFSVEDYFRHSWEAWAGDEAVRVRVHFSPDVAEMVAEVKRHDTQVIHRQTDGSVVFEVTVSGIQEIAQWIMTYGKEAMVLEPLSLRDYVLKQAKGVIERYSKVLPGVML